MLVEGNKKGIYVYTFSGGDARSMDLAYDEGSEAKNLPNKSGYYDRFERFVSVRKIK